MSFGYFPKLRQISVNSLSWSTFQMTLLGMLEHQNENKILRNVEKYLPYDKLPHSKRLVKRSNLASQTKYFNIIEVTRVLISDSAGLSRVSTGLACRINLVSQRQLSYTVTERMKLENINFRNCHLGSVWPPRTSKDCRVTV